MLRTTGTIFTSPMLALMVLCFLTPLGVLAVTSVTGPEGGFTLDNYRTFLGDAFAVGVLLDTILLGARVVGTVTLLGLPIALLYWHSGPRVRGLILVATLLPMLTSNVVRTFAWIIILGKERADQPVHARAGAVGPAPVADLHRDGSCHGSDPD